MVVPILQIRKWSTERENVKNSNQLPILCGFTHFHLRFASVLTGLDSLVSGPMETVGTGFEFRLSESEAIT